MVKITVQWLELYNLQWDLNKTNAKVMDTIKKFAEFVNESLNEGKGDKIAQEYDAEEIGQVDMDDMPNAKEIEKLVKSKKFKYIISATYVDDNGQSFNDLKASLQKARVKFTELAGEEILF